MPERFCTQWGALIAPQTKYCVMCVTPVPQAQSMLAGAVERWVGHAAPIRSLAISRDGSRLLSGSEDGTVRLWDTAAGKEVLRLAVAGSQVTSVRFSPDEASAVVGYGENPTLHRAFRKRQRNSHRSRWSRRLFSRPRRSGTSVGRESVSEGASVAAKEWRYESFLGSSGPPRQMLTPHIPSTPITATM